MLFGGCRANNQVKIKPKKIAFFCTFVVKLAPFLATPITTTKSFKKITEKTRANCLERAGRKATDLRAMMAYDRGVAPQASNKRDCFLLFAIPLVRFRKKVSPTPNRLSSCDLREHMRLTTLFFFCALSSHAVQAMMQPLDQAHWQLDASTELCQLTQSIAAEGKISFIAQPGEPLVVKLQTEQLTPPLLKASLQPVFQSWQRQPATTLATLEATQLESHQAVFTQSVAELLQHIRQGGQLQVQQQTSQAERVLTFASTQGLAASEKFNQCISQMLPLSWQQARQQRISFAYASNTVDRSYLSQLKKLADYIQLSNTIKKVLIDGHTDVVGTALANRLLSQQRADDVAAHLIEMGVPKSLIEIRAHGNRNPLVYAAKGKSEHNRRVTIRLIRSAS